MTNQRSQSKFRSDQPSTSREYVGREDLISTQTDGADALPVILDQYFKGKKQLMIFSALLLAWIFTGIDFQLLEDTSASWVRAINEDSVPLILVASIYYFSYRTIVGLVQVRQLVKNNSIALYDYTIVQTIAIVSIGLYAIDVQTESPISTTFIEIFQSSILQWIGMSIAIISGLNYFFLCLTKVKHKAFFKEEIPIVARPLWGAGILLISLGNIPLWIYVEAIWIPAGLTAVLLIGLSSLLLWLFIFPNHDARKSIHRLRLVELTKIPSMAARVVEIHNGAEFIEHNGQRLSTSLTTLLDPLSSGTESFKRLRAIVLSLDYASIKTLLVSSPGSQEGKSIVAANLAITMAQAGRRTLLIDADLRRPSQANLFGLQREHGLIELLSGTAQIDLDKYLSYIENLYVMTPDRTGFYPDEPGNNSDTLGNIRRGPSDILGSEIAYRLLKELAESFDIILIDSPPISFATDPVVLSGLCDAVLLVIRGGRTSVRSFEDAVDKLRGGHAKILGVVSNDDPVPFESRAAAMKYFRHYAKYS